MRIIVDSREQAPLPFRVGGLISEIKIEGVPFGDYWAETEWGSQMDVVFERKSIVDLWGTLTKKKNHERFKRELQRAREAEMSILLIIEGTYSEVVKGCPRSRFKGLSMIKMLFTFWMRYQLVPVFCNGKKEMMQYITSMFEARGRWMLEEKRRDKGMDNQKEA